MSRTTITLISCTLLLCVEISTGLNCSSSGKNAFKFSINSRRNTTGHWIAQVQFEHGAGHKEDGPWEVFLDHSTARCKNSDAIVIVATIAAPPQRPSSDYEFVPGLGYYKMYTKGANWREARDVCVLDGAHLLILNSEAEAGVARTFWRRHPKLFDGWRNSCAYIGIHDEYTEGQYITIFGESLNSTGYTKWAQNEPGEGKSGNSGCVGRDGSLYDTNGHNELAFFCEQEL